MYWNSTPSAPTPADWKRLIETWDVFEIGQIFLSIMTRIRLIETWDVLKLKVTKL